MYYLHLPHNILYDFVRIRIAIEWLSFFFFFFNQNIHKEWQIICERKQIYRNSNGKHFRKSWDLSKLCILGALFPLTLKCCWIYPERRIHTCLCLWWAPGTQSLQGHLEGKVSITERVKKLFYLPGQKCTSSYPQLCMNFRFENAAEKRTKISTEVRQVCVIFSQLKTGQ